MDEETNQDAVALNRPTLKVVEPEVNVDNPWCDDLLDRETMAKRLSGVTDDQEAPFVISLDGRWGTGKSFLLKRWRQALENQEFQAIYFNAWEDDFCDDPLLAIMGQLSEHFNEGKLKEMSLKIAEIALGLLTKPLIGEAIKFEDVKSRGILHNYHAQRKTKVEVKRQLAELAAEVQAESGKPLVFIIDELDRCRPTFAIELLERVKHIFDVPNIVFVFGINRDQLTKSLCSVYGDIDADEYLRRFFDMSFLLPNADPAKFCAFLAQKHGLDSFFSKLNNSQGTMLHAGEFGEMSEILPTVIGCMGLSFRDINQCVSLIALLGRNLEQGRSTFPEVLSLLVAVKISNPALYRRIVYGSARGAELVNYLNERIVSTGAEPPDSRSQKRHLLNMVEAAMYEADDGRIAEQQLMRLKANEKPNQPEYLAVSTARLDMGNSADAFTLDHLLEVVGHYRNYRSNYRGSVPHLAELLDLYSGTLRR